MCAIAGVIGLLLDDATENKMLKTMHRRGPDGQGVYRDKDTALLHARLAVINPEGGKQPMTLHWHGETYTLVYNGELYNTQELRRMLCALGHDFADSSDTRVLLHAYAQWKEECLEHLNGIYAFAVWEEKRQSLFLARDRMGVKPLFYSLQNGGMLFASELKTILSYPTVRPQIDAQGAAEIIMLGPGRTPGSGVFRGINELEPGCCGTFQDGKWNIHRYWKLTDREHTDTLEETAETVRHLVYDAIQRQMVSDVPLGTFLSGGLDSSLICAVCAKQKAREGKQLSTFSVDYVDSDRYFQPNPFQPNSDGDYIRLMQKELQTEHTWCILSPQDLLDTLDAATEARDLPGMADVDFSLLAFCRQIRKKVTVALSGECADEIFGGYPWYRDPLVRDVEGFPWAQNTSLRSDLMNMELKAKLDPVDYVRIRYQKTCLESDILPGTSPLERRMKEMMNLNIRWFMQTLLDRKDRMSMYSALEVRVPFCDHRIAQYLYSVPWSFKEYGGMEKGLLRYAMKGILPTPVMYRKKSPYPKTHDPAYLQLVQDRLQDVWMHKDAPLFAIVNRDRVKQILTEDLSWPWYGQLMRRPQLIAYLLQIQNWMTRYGINVV